MTGIRLGTPCPLCQADAWTDPNLTARCWTCGGCGVRCVWEYGVMTAEPRIELLPGSADRLARERLGPPGPDDGTEDRTWAIRNRRVCDFLHRGTAA